MKIAITVGHSKLVNGDYTSANGIKNEYLYCKEQGKVLQQILQSEGHTANLIICPEGKFTEASQEKAYKLNLVNGKGYDLLIELHLNSYNGNAKGTEVLYYPTSTKSKEYAQRVVEKLGLKFANRGVKSRDDLYMLKSTDCKAILIESFFCDSNVDCSTADSLGHYEICKLISEGILNKSIGATNNSSDGNLYAVCVGAYKDKNKANSIAEQLKSQGYTSTYLIIR